MKEYDFYQDLRFFIVKKGVIICIIRAGISILSKII